MGSLKKNLIANYIGQFYLTIIGIVMVPLYVRYMGAEGYGLVGFYAPLQAWFQLLDTGLTPALVRLVASYFNDMEARVGYITSVSMAPDWKGRGGARTLMIMALGYAQSQGFKAVTLEVGEDNLPARSLYHKLGFEEEGHTNGVVNMRWAKVGDRSQMRSFKL